ncbi:MAG: TlpA disulfide reductase family protein [Planctomycetota bacterium]
MKSLHLLVTITVIAAGLGGCRKKEEPAPPASEPTASKPTAPAPAVPTEAKLGDAATSLDGLTYIKGDAVSFEEGKITVVEFWATWCPPCLKSIPHLTELQKKYKDKDVTVIGISDEPADTVRPFVENMAEKMDYTVAIDPDKTVTKGYMAAFKQSGIPTAFIVDGQGKVAWVGYPMGELDNVLPQVIDGTFDAEAYDKIRIEQEAAALKTQKLFTEYFNAIQKGAAIEQSRPIAEKILESNDMIALSTLAWQIMMAPIDESLRDLEIALKAATKAVSVSDGKHWMAQGTHALALFKNGKVAEAIAAQEKAIELAGDNQQLRNDLNKQLEEFKAALEQPAPAAAAPVEAKLGDTAASLDGLTYVKGDAVSFEKGKVTIVEFWATWCPPCLKSIPHLTELQKKYKDKGVTVIGITTENDLEKVKAFVTKQGEAMDYTVAMDPGSKVAKGYMTAFKQNGIPAAFIVDGKGRVAWVGYPMGELDDVLPKVIDGTFDAQAYAKAKAEKKDLQAPTDDEEMPALNLQDLMMAQKQSASRAMEKIGQKAASLDGLTYVKGDAVTFEEGTVTIVEFWTTWCGPCKTSIPHLTDIQKKYKDKGVTVIGISDEDDLEKVKAFVTKQGEAMDYTVAVDAQRKVKDGYMKAFGQSAIPKAFIVDGQGNVAWVGHPMAELDDVLPQVIDGTFDAQAYAKAKAEEEARQREMSQLLLDYCTAIQKKEETLEQARPIAGKLLENGDAEILNRLAWFILTAPYIDDAKRDTETAVTAAAKANAKTNGENAAILDTYALALSKAGRLEEAVAVQQKAVELTDDDKRTQAHFKELLEQYKASLAEQTAAQS